VGAGAESGRVASRRRCIGRGRNADEVSFEQAAAIPHAAELALQAIRSAPPLRAGQEILINGAAGGVGTLAIQLLKQHDLIIDVKTSKPAHAYLGVLKPSGVCATVGGEKVFSFMLLTPLISAFTRKRLKAVMPKPNRNLAEISRLLSAGALSPELDEVFPFSEFPRALKKFHDALHAGKIVIRMP
jgi:NADPH:quinone reductase-like Zn-dependent oxidoreductase